MEWGCPHSGMPHCNGCSWAQAQRPASRRGQRHVALQIHAAMAPLLHQPAAAMTWIDHFLIEVAVKNSIWVDKDMSMEVVKSSSGD